MRDDVRTLWRNTLNKKNNRMSTTALRSGDKSQKPSTVASTSMEKPTNLSLYATTTAVESIPSPIELGERHSEKKNLYDLEPCYAALEEESSQEAETCIDDPESGTLTTTRAENPYMLEPCYDTIENVIENVAYTEELATETEESMESNSKFMEVAPQIAFRYNRLSEHNETPAKQLVAELPEVAPHIAARLSYTLLPKYHPQYDLDSDECTVIPNSNTVHFK